MKIAPSVLSSDFSNISHAVRKFELAGADIIHFDVMDGQFVPPITFGSKFVFDLRPLTELPFEAHLMTLTPERHFESFAMAGCKRIIFHVEATSHAHKHAQTLRSMGIEAGIAINPGTPAHTIEPLLDVVDVVLVMTVNPGWGGQEFISSCLAKVEEIRSMTSIDIEVDGGVDPDTISWLYKAGANVFVTGSYLARAMDTKAAIEDLKKACVHLKLV